MSDALNRIPKGDEITLPRSRNAGSTRKTGTNAIGRPARSPHSREEILDAAEACFARTGYAATSLREICDEVGVTQAMVNYYFGSKHDLFREVYIRRGSTLQHMRMANLERLSGQQSHSVDELLRAYLTPAFEMLSDEPGRSFLRLQARLHAEPDEFYDSLRAEVYELPVRAYVSALCMLLPDVPEHTIYLRFTEMIGIYLYILSGAHRLPSISEGKYDIPSAPEMVEEIVRFCTNGFASR